MADVFRKNNYEIKPVLQFMLTSDTFFSPQYKGAKIKNPMETTIGILKAFDLTPATNNPYFRLGLYLYPNASPPAAVILPSRCTRLGTATRLD